MSLINHKIFQTVFIFLALCAVETTAATKPDAVFKGTAYAYGEIYDSVLQSDDKRILAGLFIETNGDDRNRNIVRLNPDNSVDATFTAQTDERIFGLLRQTDGKIIIGGFFDTVNGTPKEGFARLNPDGSLDPTFAVSTLGTIFGDSWNWKLQPDGKILICGGFFPGIARLNPDGSRDTTFNVGAGPRFQNQPGSIAHFDVQPDGKIVVTGRFDTFNNIPQQYISRLNPDGSVDTGFSTNGTSEGSAVLILADGKILWAGIETLLKFNADGSIDGGFLSSVSPANRTNLRQQTDGKILVSFYNFVNDPQDGNFVTTLARLNLDGSADSSFTRPTATDAIIYGLSQLTNGKIFAHGHFYRVNNAQRIGVFELQSNGALDNAPLPVIKHRGSISDLVPLPDGKIIVGGSFYEINGVQRENIARLNPNGTIDQTFAASFESLGTSPPYYHPVRKIIRLANGKLLIGGRFHRVNGAAKFQIVRLNQDGTLDDSFIIPRNSVISAFQYFPLAVQSDGKILTNGGNIQTGIQSWRVARFNSDGSFDASFNSVNGLAADIAIGAADRIYAAGYFFAESFDVVRLKSNGAIDTSFAGVPETGGINSTALAVQPDGKLLVGRIGEGLIRVNENGSRDTAFVPTLISSNSPGFPRVWKILVQPDNKIIVGGAFSQVNSLNRRSLVRLNPDGSTDAGFNADNLIVTDGVTIALGLQANGNLVFGSRFNRPDGKRQDLSRLLNSSAPADFDGDGKTDVAVFRPAAGNWFALASSNNALSAVNFGSSSDKLTPADFDGDGRTDIAVFRPANGVWYVLRSSDNAFSATQFGQNNDAPVAADYDADGRADLAVFRAGSWFVRRSSDNSFRAFQFGLSTDAPVAGDFDGDGFADFTVFRQGAWFSQQTRNGFRAVQFGQTGDAPLRGDFDGDGRQDFSIFRAGNWFILNSRDNSFRAELFGLATDVPTAGDFDGDNLTDIAVWRATATNGVFYVSQSSDRTLRALQFGQNGDLPVN